MVLGGRTLPPATVRVINFAVALVQKTLLLKNYDLCRAQSLRVSKELQELTLVPHFSINSGWLSATQLT
jgi:hypothetical protein